MAACVAFSPDGNYFFNSPTKWSRNGLPAGIEALFTHEPKIKGAYGLALGPDGPFVIAYQNQNNLSADCHLMFNGIPAGLEKWLVPVPGKGVARDLTSLSVALGSNGAYFAFDKNGSAWGNLPVTMNTAIEAARDRHGRFMSGRGPQSVAFGPEWAYFYITAGGGGNSNLPGQSEGLNKFLKDSKSLNGMEGPSLLPIGLDQWESQEHVILSPVQAGNYMLVGLNGYCYSRLPNKWHEKNNQFKPDWQQSRAPHPSAAVTHSHSNSASVGRSIVKGLGLVNNILNAANSNNNSRGGGGGQMYINHNNNNNEGTGRSNFWSPI